MSLQNVRANLGAAQIEAEEAELSMAERRLRLVLKGDGTVTLPAGTQVQVMTGPFDRMQRDEGLTRTLRALLSQSPSPRQPELSLSHVIGWLNAPRS